MPNLAPSSPFMQELLAGHMLAKECAACALRFLERAATAGAGTLDLRANLEAVRMAGLYSRLTEGLRHVRAIRRLPDMAEAGAADNAKEKSASAAPKFRAAPGERRGRLKNGNPSGDYLRAPRCGARTRAGGCRRQPAMPNGRCRMRGGKSTGPRTTAGLARCRAARLTHGYRTRALIALRRRATHAARRLGGLVRSNSAGHGLHRSLSVRHGDRRETMIVRRARVMRPENPSSVSSVVNPASAGHGLHRTKSATLQRPSAFFRGRLCSSVSPLCLVSAGHGLHRPDSSSPVHASAA